MNKKTKNNKEEQLTKDEEKQLNKWLAEAKNLNSSRIDSFTLEGRNPINGLSYRIALFNKSLFDIKDIINYFKKLGVISEIGKEMKK